MIDSWQVTPSENGPQHYELLRQEDLDIVDNLTNKPILEAVSAIDPHVFKIQNPNDWAKTLVTSEPYKKATAEIFSGTAGQTLLESIKAKQQNSSMLDQLLEKSPEEQELGVGEEVIGGISYAKYIKSLGNEMVFVPKNNDIEDIPSFSIKIPPIIITPDDGASYKLVTASVFKEAATPDNVKVDFSLNYDPNGQLLSETRTVTLPTTMVNFTDQKYNQCKNIEICCHQPLVGEHGNLENGTIQVSNLLSYNGDSGRLAKYLIKGETDTAIQVANDDEFNKRVGFPSQKPFAVKNTANKLAFTFGQYLLGKQFEDATFSSGPYRDNELAIPFTEPEIIKSIRTRAEQLRRENSWINIPEPIVIPEEMNSALAAQLSKIDNKLTAAVGARDNYTITSNFKEAVTLGQSEDKILLNGLSIDAHMVPEKETAESTDLEQIASSKMTRYFSIIGFSHEENYDWVNYLLTVSRNQELSGTLLADDKLTAANELITEQLKGSSSLAIKYQLNEAELEPLPAEVVPFESLCRDMLIEYSQVYELEGWDGQFSTLATEFGLSERDIEHIKQDFRIDSQSDQRNPSLEEFQAYLKYASQPRHKIIQLSLE